MVDVFTDHLRLNQQEVGAKFDLWGPPVSAGLNDGVTALIEQAVAERADIDVTAGNILLTEVDGGTDTSRPVILRVFGTPGVARTITVPDIAAGLPTQKFYILYNASDSDVSLRTVTNVGVSAAVGQSLLLMVDEVLDNVFSIALGGTVVFEAINWLSGTFDISGSAGTGTYRYASQGNIGMWLFPAFVQAVTINNFTITPLVPAAWPAAIVPVTSFEDYPCYVTSSADGATIFRTILDIGSSAGAGRTFRRLDGGGTFTTTTTFTLINNFAAVFPLRLF